MTYSSALFKNVKFTFKKKPNPTQPNPTPSFEPYFFNQPRCQQRAYYLTHQLKQRLDGIIHPPQTQMNKFWRTICHRLYTLNYLLYVLQLTDHPCLRHGQPGTLEAAFAVGYALQRQFVHRRKTLLQDAFENEHPDLALATQVLAGCLASEARAVDKDRLYDVGPPPFRLHILLEEYPDLEAVVKEAVKQNDNPFEDETLVVTEDWLS